MTIKELHAAIKAQTMDINKRLVEYYEAGTKNKLVEKEIEFLKEVSGTSQKSSYISMRTHRKNKAELELQLQELRYFGEWDIFTPGGQAERTSRELRAYRSYKKNHKSNLSYESYRRMVNILGTAGEDVLKQFGNSDDKAGAVEEAVRKGKKSGTIMKTLRKVYDKNKGAQKSSQDYIDDLRAELDLTT